MPGVVPSTVWHVMKIRAEGGWIEKEQHYNQAMTEENIPPEPSYEGFYKKFHDLSERALAPCYYIRDSLTVMQSYAEKNPGLFPGPEIQTQLKAFGALARDFGVNLRGFFWPRPGDDLKRDIVLSLERWQPYDQAAWEAVTRQQQP